VGRVGGGSRVRSWRTGGRQPGNPGPRRASPGRFQLQADSVQAIQGVEVVEVGLSTRQFLSPIADQYVVFYVVDNTIKSSKLL